MTNQDRRRREAWARRIAEDQRLEARRAAAIVRTITRKLRSIELDRRASIGGLRGAGIVTAILPNGRRTRLRIVPTLAPIAEVRRATAALAAALAAAVKQLTAEQVKSDRNLGRRLVEAVNLLDRRAPRKARG
jgi:hypothetical protein